MSADIFERKDKVYAVIYDNPPASMVEIDEALEILRTMISRLDVYDHRVFTFDSLYDRVEEVRSRRTECKQ